MLETRLPTTLVTVTHSRSDRAFTERFPIMLKHYTPVELVRKHVVVMSEETREQEERVRRAFAVLPWPVQFIQPGYNCWDMPGYNLAAAQVETTHWVGISCDTRVCQRDWLDYFAKVGNERTGIVGARGPAETLTPEKSITDQRIGWVGRLLLDRGLEFDTCEHIQTWCFMMNTAAFREVGGCWVPPKGGIQGKGDLIAAEVYLSVSLRRAGWSLGAGLFPIHHYGTGGVSEDWAPINLYDEASGFGAF